MDLLFLPLIMLITRGERSKAPEPGAGGEEGSRTGMAGTFNSEFYIEFS